MTPERFRTIAEDVVGNPHSARIALLYSATMREEFDKALVDIESLQRQVDELKAADDANFLKNAHQHDSRFHPFTCGNDSRHRPLVATLIGWRCADCDYVQPFGHPCEEMMGKAPRSSIVEAFDALRKAANGRFDDVDPDQYVRDLRAD